MILGAVVFRLKALVPCRLPASHGRLLHAALLNIIREVDPLVSQSMHDASAKNFSLSCLEFSRAAKSNTIDVREGDRAYWRVCALGEEVLKALMAIPLGQKVKIAAFDFLIEDVLTRQEQREDAGFVSMEYLEEGCRNLPSMRSVTLEFLSPTVFRVGSADYPFPLPALIFGSIAERWNEFSTNGTFEVDMVKAMAEKLVPINWSAETRRYNITPQRGITGFVGRITFDLREIKEDLRWIFILLSEFSVFTGVGRLTGQGLGHVKISYSQ